MNGKKLCLWTAVLGAGLLAGAARADYVNNFDTAPYSTNNGVRLNAIGADNVSGTSWIVFTQAPANLGVNFDAVASTVNPFGGSGGHLRITDTAAVSQQNIAARLDLSPVLPNLTNTFSISFKLATTGVNYHSGGIFFGANNDFDLSQNWFYISPGAGGRVNINYRDAALGGTASSFFAKQADGTTEFLAAAGSYFDVFAQINPTTYEYESFKINGVEQIGLGTNPATLFIPATTTPAKVFRFFSGAGTVGTVDIDNVSIIPIPEPATLGLLALGGLMMVTRRSK